MTKPVDSNMKEFVQSEIQKITTEHQKMISGWNNVDFTDENITHLYNLFKSCTKQEIRLFEENNFLDEKKKEEVTKLITKKLTQEKDCPIENPTKQIVKETKTTKKGNKKKSTNRKHTNVSEHQKENDSCNKNAIENNGDEIESLRSTDELVTESLPDQSVDSKQSEQSSRIENEKTAESPAKTDEKSESISEQSAEKQESEPTENEETSEVTTRIITENTCSNESNPEESECDITKLNNETKETGVNDEPGETTDLKQNEPNEELSKSSAKTIGMDELVQNNDETTPSTQSEEQPRKKTNPFDNENLFIEPLINNTPNTKERPTLEELEIALGNQYMSQESNILKSNLQKLSADISTEEQNIREKMEASEPATIDRHVLEDFIARANVVLKETEAVTVRKIAEAETKKFLSSLKIPIGDATETITNELVQDIWPKTNRWRSFARNENRDESQDEIDLKTKKKQDEQVERDVRAAIKSAGESLTKKQIGQIRKAVIVYRDFDSEEQKELDYRNNHIQKLTELVSAYETNKQMDDLMILRLAIAFCTKRRDHFLKYRPPNFMQFSYMYIYLLEKINSRTAIICACLNHQSTVGKDFDELEELMLNLYHEEYFLEDY
uniref:SPK domain-containing protein n=1 Tax=Caenorhabditis tropicalis TaxID=1561998 RepID=A0A1I7TCU6_9PELO